MAHHFTRSDNLYEDLTVGETIVHPRGRTISDEHMMWTNFVLNTAQLHFNQKMCDDQPEVTFDGRRVVYGGIVFPLLPRPAPEGTAGNAHPPPPHHEGGQHNPRFRGHTTIAEE